jgi:protein-tyrosine kinase
MAPTLVERAAEHLRRNVRRTALGLGSSSQQSVASSARGPIATGVVSPTPPGVPAAKATRGGGSRKITLDRSRLRAAHIIDWSGTRTQVSEEFRVIKRQLLRQAFPSPGGARAGANLVMITSARPGEGKTFTALNLALGIATEPSRHVLLVDADTSRQGVGEVIGLKDQCGLLDVLSDDEPDLSQVMLRTDIPNFALLLGGVTRDNAAELLAGSRMAALLREMSLRYSDRVILIDAPPCLVSSDPMSLSASVGKVIMVIEADKTQNDEITVALDMVKDCQNVSLILNKTRVNSSMSLGSYGSY